MNAGNLAGVRLASGDTFGRWTIINFSHTDKRNAYFVCACECGRLGTVRRWSLVSGHSRSCGCLGNEVRRAWARDHAGRQFPRRTKPKPKRVRVAP